MIPRSKNHILAHVTGLAIPGERATAIRKLARELQLKSIVIFVSDPELKLLLPAPGFVQTLPAGGHWRKFLDQTLEKKVFEGELPWKKSTVFAQGIAARDGSVIVLVGNRAPANVVNELSLLLPVLAAALNGERAAATADSKASLARQIAAQANDLSQRLDVARRAAQVEIGARIKAEEEVRHANQTLENRVIERTHSLTEALAQLEEFSYTVSHDLRAPLRSITTFAQILLDDYSKPLPPEACDFLRRIVESSHRMNQLTHDVLSFTRIARAEFELSSVNLDPLIADIARQYSQAVPLAKLKIQKPLGVVCGNAPLLVQCVNNLFDNAVKYSHPDRPPVIQLSSTMSEGHLRLSFKDNGVGIPAQYQEQIFKIFERLDLGKPGTGVGLAIVKRAVDRMRGKLGVISQPNVGSTFWIELVSA